MSDQFDLIGQTFCNLTVTERSETIKKRRMWKCSCKCGGERVVAGKYLRNGDVKSCGCLRGYASTHSNCSHGEASIYTRTPEYDTWSHMKNRCLNTKNKDFKWYGGRGIKICERWLNSYEDFLSDMGRRPAGGTLDRKDSNGDYCKDNCRWITIQEQQRNKRSNHLITINGVTKILEDWCLDFHISRKTVHGRINLGWAIEDLFLPPRQIRNPIHNGSTIRKAA